MWLSERDDNNVPKWRQWESYSCVNVDSVHNDGERHLAYIMTFGIDGTKSKMRAWAKGAWKSMVRNLSLLVTFSGGQREVVRCLLNNVCGAYNSRKPQFNPNIFYSACICVHIRGSVQAVHFHLTTCADGVRDPGDALHCALYHHIKANAHKTQLTGIASPA